MLQIDTLVTIRDFLNFFVTIILLNKFWVSFSAFEFVWAHVALNENKSTETRIVKAGVLLLLSACICHLTTLFGYMLTPMIFLLYLGTFYRASSYGLEDIYCSVICGYLALIQVFAFNSGVEISENIAPVKYIVVPEALLTIAMCLIFFSAAGEKLRSGLWRQGRAVHYFFVHPKFRKLNISFITENKKISTALSYAMILIQLLPIFCLIFLPAKFLIVFGVGLTLFTLVLIVFFHYYVLAEFCLAGCVIMLLTSMFLWDENLFFYLFGQVATLSMLQLTALYSFFAVCCIYFIVNFFSEHFIDKLSKNIPFIGRFFKIPRVVLGLLRVGVYTERHLSNPIAFDILANKKGSKAAIFTLFRDDGSPNLRNVFLLPTAFLCSAFKIHDILIQLDTEAKVKAEDYLYLKGYLRYLQRFSGFPRLPGKLYLWINELNLYGHIEKNEELSSSMHPVLEITADEQLDLDFKVLRRPILSGITKRKYRVSRFRVN